jgi:aromatic-L-amino-acid decarboxylase
MVFRAFGRSGIISRIREHRRLASLFAAWVQAEPDFVLSAPVVTAVVCFRYQPTGLKPELFDELNRAAVETVNARGKVYLTHTRLNDETVMRIGIGNMSTIEMHLADAWKTIRREAEALSRPQERTAPKSPTAPIRNQVL